MKESTLFLITANDCSACDHYNKVGLQKITQYVNLEHINLDKMEDKVPEKYPQELNEMIQWYPCFVLQTNNSFTLFYPNIDGNFDPQSMIEWVTSKIIKK